MIKGLNAVTILWLATEVVLAGCSPVLKRLPSRVDMLETLPSDRPGTIIHTASGRRLSFERLIDELSDSRAIFIGEVHDDAEDHLVQAQIFHALMVGSKPVSVGVEYLPWTLQDKADAYIARELSEEMFLEASEWNKNWGYPFYLVRPIFMAARQRGAGIVFINAPKEIVAKVAKLGLKGLSAAERAFIAKEIDLENSEHRRYVKAAFDVHPHFSPGVFDYFYEAQCAWEETMAEKAAEYLGRAEGILVICCGRGHIVEGFGIPDRLRKRTMGNVVTVLPVKQGTAVTKNIADYVWITGGRVAAAPMREGSDKSR